MKLSNAIILLILALITAPISAYVPIDPTSDDEQFGGLKVHKPGLKVRMTQAFSDMIKKNLLQYGTAYLNWDLQWKRQGTKRINTFPIYTDVHYRNLKWDPFKIDIEKAQLNYTHMVVDDTPVVYMEVPAIKHWTIAFDYMYKILRTH